MVISTLMYVILFFGAQFLVKYMLSPEFADSVYVIQIRSISLLFSAIFQAYGSNYLIIKHQEALLRKITMYCSLAGFAIALPLLYFYGYIGVSLTVTISLGMLAIFSYTASIKIIKNKS